MTVPHISRLLNPLADILNLHHSFLKEVRPDQTRGMFKPSKPISVIYTRLWPPQSNFNNIFNADQ